MYDSWVAYFRTQSRWNLYRFYGRAQKSWDQFDEYDSRKLRSGTQTSAKTKPAARKISSQSSSSAQSLRFRIGLRKRLNDRSDVPAETRGDWPSTSQRLVSLSTIRNNTGGNNPGQKPWICIFRSTRGVAISVQLENRVNFAPTVAPDPLAARFFHRTFLFGAILAITSGPWTSPLLDAAAISWSSSTCTRTGRRRVAALG